LTVPGATGRFDLALVTTLFPTDTPPSLPYTSLYTVPGFWDVLETGGGGFGRSTGAANGASVTDDHPAWDALAFTADTETGGAQSSGETLISGAALVLSDPSRTALSSNALLPMPPFSAFASGDIAVSFLTMPDEEQSFEGSGALVLGRVISPDDDPSTPAYRCPGFAAPAHPRVTLRNEHRRLQLNAALTRGDGQPVGTGELVSRPIIRVLSLTGLSYVTSLAADDGRFSARGGRWTYTLQGDALPGPGRYLVYMSTPDSDEYVFDQLCTVEVTVP
jgi:hypothetical protein